LSRGDGVSLEEYDNASTRQSQLVYLQILRWPGDAITLHSRSRKVIGSSLLTGGQVEVR